MTDPKPRTQYAALPYRMRGDAMEIMLVTTRRTGRWIIPKGWPEKGLTPPQVAAKEAYEEAGLYGAIGEQAVGTFRYRKNLGGGQSTLCNVVVYPLLTERQLDDWPEKGQRRTLWLTPGDAASRVQEESLSELIAGFAQTPGAAVGH